MNFKYLKSFAGFAFEDHAVGSFSYNTEHFVFIHFSADNRLNEIDKLSKIVNDWQIKKLITGRIIFILDCQLSENY